MEGRRGGGAVCEEQHSISYISLFMHSPMHTLQLNVHSACVVDMFIQLMCCQLDLCLLCDCVCDNLFCSFICSHL